MYIYLSCEFSYAEYYCMRSLDTQFVIVCLHK